MKVGLKKINKKFSLVSVVLSVSDFALCENLKQGSLKLALKYTEVDFSSYYGVVHPQTVTV